MCSRVLGAWQWSRPGRVDAGCDARVLGLIAAHVGGLQEGAAVPRSGQRVAVAWGGGPGSQHPTREPYAKRAAIHLVHGIVRTGAGRPTARALEVRAPAGLASPGSS